MLIYLKPGDKYQANDVLEFLAPHYNPSEPFVVTRGSFMEGTFVTEFEVRNHKPRRWVEDWKVADVLGFLIP